MKVPNNNDDNMIRTNILVFFITIFVYSFIYSQEIKFYGNFLPGTVVIGEGENIVWAWIDSTQLKVASQKMFVLGFDAKETGSKIIKIKHGDGKVLLKKINLINREYKIQRINNNKQQFSETPDSLKLRLQKESEISEKARNEIGKIDTAFFKVGFIRPINGGIVTGVFGSQRILNGVERNLHNGFDIAVPTGTPVFAMTDGIVRLTADNFYYSGNYILLDHGQGLNSFYLHLNEIVVKEGQKVKKGQIIGKVGTTGRSTGPHLHWGVQWFSKRVDPKAILDLNFNPKK